jgi:hypothetical protein
MALYTRDAIMTANGIYFSVQRFDVGYNHRGNDEGCQKNILLYEASYHKGSIGMANYAK